MVSVFLFFHLGFKRYFDHINQAILIDRQLKIEIQTLQHLQL